jgi:hypothetical protein
VLEEDEDMGSIQLGRRVATVILFAAVVAIPWGDAGAQRGGAHRRGGGGAGGLSGMVPRALVDGRVTSVDATTGHVVLAVGERTVEADFPLSKVADVKPADPVILTVELIDTRVGVITGPVTSVDPTAGTVTVQTSRGPWPVTFSRDAVSDVKPGDHAVLRLGLVDLGSPPRR